MFTARAQKNRGAATTYFEEHLSQNDYYCQDVGFTQQSGQWIGIGVERLGLKQGNAVDREAFVRLCDNEHPSENRGLTASTVKERRIFFDFQCAPPKSVSLLGVTMQDERILRAHREASEVAFRELETFASARIRKGGVENRDRITGNLVGASFLHTASRALDPQLHTHYVLFNATFDSVEGQWKALQTSAMFQAIHYGTSVYRNELAKRLREIGYALRPTANGFEIEGVPQELIERFSKRSKQRDEAVRCAEKRLGRKLSNDEVAHLVHQSRPSKLKDISEQEVHSRQLHEIGFFEKRALRRVVAAADGTATSASKKQAGQEALSYALSHVFERQSVAPRYRILEAALAKRCGDLDLPQLKKDLNDNADLVQVGDEFSTRQILRQELFLIGTVNACLNTVVPLAESYQPPENFGPDQRRALTHLVTGRDRFTGVRGLAGTGKSTVLVELARVLEFGGWRPVFCAPTAAAVEVLRKDLKALRHDPVTLASLVANGPSSWNLNSKSVVILDEAGAVGTADMVKLFELVNLRHARVILSGDTGQHASVAHGDALRIIEGYSRYQFAELNTIRRQRAPEFRQAVKLAAHKQTAKAFEKLEQLGALTEKNVEDGELYRKAAEAYLEGTRLGRSVLLVSPTWAEIEAVTATVRGALRSNDELGREEQAFRVFDSLSWTAAQKKDPGSYVPAHRVRFVRAAGGFTRGEIGEVVGVDGARVTLRRVGGSEATFSPGRLGASVEVGEMRELKISTGDWLLLQANASSSGQRFTNGERVQVKRLAGGDTIELADGRILPADYRTFTHGYAVTSHSSQGKTVDEVLVVASSRSFGAVGQEQFYVSISRARDRMRIFTDDIEALRSRVGNSKERQAAVELVTLREKLAEAGLKPVKANKTSINSAICARFRAIHPLRSLRLTRAAPVQKLAHMASWFADRIARTVGLERRQKVAEVPVQHPALSITYQVPTTRHDRARGIGI